MRTWEQAQYDAKADEIGRAIDKAQAEGDIERVQMLDDLLMDLGPRPLAMVDALADMRREVARLRDAVARLQAEPLVVE